MSAAHPVSPLAPVQLARLEELAGVRLAATAAGIRYTGRKDLLLAVMDEGASIAGVFTRSKTASAPVDWCRAQLKGGRARAIVVNAGNANAFTGSAGVKAVKASASAAARAVGCPPEEVFLASTGVIGEAMDARPIEKALPGLAAAARADAWDDAARAIMTTDTYPKLATRRARLGGAQVTINGIAKGSGMIAPDMATMLVFLFTDAALPPRILQRLLQRAVGPSFNCISVDGDTSTSDTVLLCATGKAGARLSGLRSADDQRLKGFARALDALCLDLAHQVVKDGEGAEKFVAVTVTGAETEAAARRIGLVVANSPLVKTAIAGNDANWGRIVMAVGRAGEKAERDRLKIAIGGVTVARAGKVAPGYREADLEPHMRGRDIDIAIDVGVGKGRATVWTCDLTHRYIDINGSYRS